MDMRRHEYVIPLALLVAGLLWTGPFQGQIGAKTNSPKKATGPSAESFVVVLTSPTEQERAQGRVARFQIRRSGEGMAKAESHTWVKHGEKFVHLKPGELKTFLIRAHPSDLQRIRIENHTVLVHVPPGSTFMLSDNPCFFWQLSGPGLDPHLAKAPDAMCIPETSSCPKGLEEAAGPGRADDPLCPAGLRASGRFKRCVRAAVIEWSKLSKKHTVKRAHIETGDWKPVEQNWTAVPGRCNFSKLDTGVERVLLAVGVGQRWQLQVGHDGYVRGRVIPSR